MMKHQKKITAFVASSLPRLISSVFLICGLLLMAVSVSLFIGPFAPIPQQSPAQIQNSEPVAEIVASPTPELQPEIAIHSSVPSLPPVQITPVLDSPAPAQAPQSTKTQFVVEGSDIDLAVLATAQDNAQKSGARPFVHFVQRDLADFKPEQDSGIVVCNPPYGERLLDLKESEKIYRTMGKVFVKKAKWTYHILSPHNQFEKIFGRKAFRNRKVYNGKIKCYLYSFA